MFKIFMTTLLCTFLGSLFAFFLFIGQGDVAVFAAMMVFGCIFFPVLIATFLFQIIKQRVRSKSTLRTFLLRVGALLLVLVIGIFVWIVADVAFSELSWESFKTDYETQFSGFMVIGVFVALTMPLVDLWLDKWLSKNKEQRS